MRIVHSSELNRVLRGVEVRYYIVTCIRKVLDKRISPRPTFKDIIRPHAGEDVIAVTANAYTDDIRQCRVAGMQGHLAKPLRMGDLSRVIAQWSASPGDDDTRPAPAKLATAKPAAAKRDAATSPRLRKMFADRLTATRDAIAAAQAMDSIDRDTRDEIAGLLHQIAGTAAYFDGAELGSQCLETEKALLACEDNGEMRAMLTRIDRLLGQESPEETNEDE